MDHRTRLAEIMPTDTRMLHFISELRIRVWAERLPLFLKLESRLDKVDLWAHHWAYLDKTGLPVAAARLSIHSSLASVPDAESYPPFFQTLSPGPFASMNRLAVLPEYRGCGLATQLDQIRIEFSRKAGCSYILGLTPSGEGRVRAMEKLGFTQTGAVCPSEDQRKMGILAPSIAMFMKCNQPAQYQHS
ncbi:MAG: GNAT family N-acetyltransferase [Proteobacteria bacterium]|nr:GNAT family N-acetyltransferase [Pseudomonadota bacterium]